MEGLRQYILSVLAAAWICGMIRHFVGKEGAAAGLVRMLSGLLLAFAVLRPIANLHVSDLREWSAPFADAGEAAAASGAEMAKDELRAIIKTRCEAYILDKAASMNAELSVQVTLSDDQIPVPQSVVLKGSVSPYARRRLEEVITGELGIAKENQTWIP